MSTQLAMMPETILEPREPGLFVSPFLADESRCIYAFSDGRAEGSRDMVAELGGKGAGLVEMTNLGVPVPPGFTITCRVCDEFLTSGKVPDEVIAGIRPAMA